MMPRRIGFRLTLPLAAFAVISGSACFAQATIDQQSTFASSFLGPSTAAGQSFTPSLNGIDFATFNLATSGTTSTFLVNLFAGDGFSGPLLASTPSQTFTNNAAFQPTTFVFPSTVALTPGQVYTLQLAQVSDAGIYELEGSGDPYAGGVEYGSTGLANNDYDFVFSEGVDPSVVPEPGSVALFIGMSTMGAGFLIRRKKAQKSA